MKATLSGVNKQMKRKPIFMCNARDKQVSELGNRTWMTNKTAIQGWPNWACIQDQYFTRDADGDWSVGGVLDRDWVRDANRTWPRCADGARAGYENQLSAGADDSA